MKKITLKLAVLALFLTNSAFAQFTESFESATSGIPNDTGWTKINGGSASFWTTETNGLAYEGTNVASITFKPEAHDDYLISPQISVTNGVNDRFSFWARSNRNDYKETYSVKISTGNANLASDFTITALASNTYNKEWRQHIINLSSYAGQSVYVAIHVTSADKDRLYIDNVVNNGYSESAWTGTTDNDWPTINNWDSGAVPTSADNVTITNVTNQPSVGAGVTAQVNDLTISPSSSFNILAGGAVIVHTDLNTNETITMNSTNSNSSVLLVKGSSTGQVSYERGGLLANKWSIISAPVSGQTIKEFAENATNDIRINNTVIPNRYAIGYYDDSKVAGSKWVYYTKTDLNTNALTFEEGKSYIISRATDGSITFTGTLRTSSLNKTVTASEWNAIGNPYTAFLSINENGGVNFINDNLDNFDAANVGAYIWDNAQNKYVAHSLITSEKSLAPGQGIFVKMKAGASMISFKESQRKTQPATGGVFAKGTLSKNIPSIQLFTSSNGVTVDTNIKYLATATNGLDAGYDLENFKSPSLDVYTSLLDKSNTKDFTIQSLPNVDYKNTIIPVGVTANSGSELTFSVKALNLPEDIEVFIEDKKRNVHTRLSDNGTYSIKLTDKTDGTGRFYLHTNSKKPEQTLSTSIENISIHKSSKSELTITGLQSEKTSLTIFSILGKRVFTKEINSNGNNTVTLPKITSGVYIIELASELGKTSKKIILE